MSELKLSDATHVGYDGNRSFYAAISGNNIAFLSQAGHNLFVPGCESLMQEITDLIPEGYTGSAEEFTLDCLKRDLDEHDVDSGGARAFRFADGFFRYSYHRLLSSDAVLNNEAWHPMPKYRGRVGEAVLVNGAFDAEECEAGDLGVSLNFRDEPWNDEGLPPVGSQWMIDASDYDIRDMSFTLEPVEVMATFHTRNAETDRLPMVAVRISNGCCDCFRADMLRPIKTDREKAIEAIAKNMADHYADVTKIVHDQSRYTSHATSLIDALDAGEIPGYGKLEK